MLYRPSREPSGASLLSFHPVFHTGAVSTAEAVRVTYDIEHRKHLEEELETKEAVVPRGHIDNKKLTSSGPHHVLPGFLLREAARNAQAILFGGFLLRRGCALRPCGRLASDHPSTGIGLR